MPDPKLIETRGTEPAFLPAQPAETWQRVEMGLGATPMPAAPGASPDQPEPPVRRRHHRWAGFLFFVAAAAMGMAYVQEHRTMQLISVVLFLILGIAHQVAARRNWRYF
jgi:hypothetical protein